MEKATPPHTSHTATTQCTSTQGAYLICLDLYTLPLCACYEWHVGM